MKKLLIIIMVPVLMLGGLFSITAVADNNSYYYDNSQKTHEAPNGYAVKSSVSLTGIGEDNYKQIVDMATDDEGKIYLLSSESGKITVLDNSMQYLKTIAPTFEQEDNCVGASGFYISEYNDKFSIYIADTNHSRIVKISESGKVEKIFLRPETTLVAKKTEFHPLKIVANKSGMMFVLCQGIYSGAIIMNEDGEFLGFYGSNKIKLTATVLYDYIWKSIFGSSRSDISRYVPIEFSNLAIDSNGFIYTVTSSKADDTGIKYLNFNGENLFPEKNYGDLETLTSSGEELKSSFIDIVSLGDGIVATLDVSRNRIFVYNDSADLLTIIGGQGSYNNTFITPAAIAAFDDGIYVYDKHTATISLFVPNNYGSDLLLASRLYSEGKYEESKELWEKVLEQNNGFQTAYISIGRTLMSQNDYAKAMEYFKLGNAKSDYSKAKGEIRKQFLQNWFLPIFIGLVILIALTFYFLSNKRIRRKNEVSSIPATLSYAVFHPLKSEARFFKSDTMLSKWLLLIILPVWFISNIISTQYSGFIFNSLEEHPLDLRVEFIATFVLAFVFVLANWLIVTMTDGNGKLAEIATVVAVALIPYIAGKILTTGLSNIMLIDEGMIVNAPIVLCTIWMAIILINGLAKIHEFTILGAVKNVAFTVIGMLALAFLLLLEISILKQIQMLMRTILDEIIMMVV